MENIYKSGIFLITIGCLPLIFLTTFYCEGLKSELIPKILLATAFTACGIGALLIMFFSADHDYWLSVKKLKEERAAYLKSRLDTERYMEAVKRVAVNAQGFTAVEVGKRYDTLEKNNWKSK